MSSTTIAPPDVRRFAAVPLELTERKQWVCWHREERKGKLTKIPYNAKTGRPASSTDPNTWCDYSTALEAYVDHADRYDGIGFVVTADDPYVAIDIDHCIVDGEIEPEKKTLVEAINSYTEISPSGTGLRMFTRAKLPEGIDGRKNGCVEVYHARRYVTVTGNHLPGTPSTIEDRQAEVMALYREVFGDDENKQKPSAKVAQGLPDDQKIIDKVIADPKWARVWSGNSDGYPSASEADLAICGRIGFFAGPDPSAVDRLFRQSGRTREKWDREDYRNDTINKAMSGKTEFYRWNGSSPQILREAVADSDEPISSPVLTRLSGVTPQAYRWLWKHRIALGKLTLIFGDPGLGKSFLCLYLIAATTTGSPWPDGTEPDEIGSAIIISAEDDLADTIRVRLDAAGADVSKVVALEAIRVRLEGGKIAERSFTLADLSHLRTALKQNPDCKIVVIDPVSAYVGKSDDHRNSDIRGLLAPLAKLASEFGVAIVMVTHQPKGGAGAKAVHRAMGSLAFLAAARAAWLVVRDEVNPDRRLFLPVKNNIGNDQTGFAYSIVNGALSWEKSPVTTTADQALSAAEGDGRPGPDPEALDAAIEWVQEMLRYGDVPAATMKDEAKAAGLGWRTVHRAKDKLGVRSYREQFGKEWTWRLPQREGK